MRWEQNIITTAVEVKQHAHARARSLAGPDERQQVVVHEVEEVAREVRRQDEERALRVGGALGTLQRLLHESDRRAKGSTWASSTSATLGALLLP